MRDTQSDAASACPAGQNVIWIVYGVRAAPSC